MAPEERCHLGMAAVPLTESVEFCRYSGDELAVGVQHLPGVSQPGLRAASM